MFVNKKNPINIAASTRLLKEVNMSDRENLITMHGNPLTLTGIALTEGDNAPDFEAMDNDLNPKTLGDYNESVLIISSVPSLDTPVCDIETRRFNTEALQLGSDIRFLTISMDLPFAQKRWCGAAGIDRVTTLSDYKTGSFGKAYGLRIKELGLLARAVFVLDENRVIRHMQIVGEISQEPDYGRIIEAVRNELEK